MANKNEFNAELVAVLKKTGYAFGYDRMKVKEENDNQGFYLYRLISHSGVAHTNWVTKEALQNYLQAKAK